MSLPESLQRSAAVWHFATTWLVFLVSCPSAGAQTNVQRHLFSVRAGQNRLLASPSDPLPGRDAGEADARAAAAGTNRSAPSSASKVPQREGISSNLISPSTSFTVGTKWEAVLYYAASDEAAQPVIRSPLSRKATAREGVIGRMKSLPLGVLETFNVYDPEPIDNGPAPSSLPLSSRPRVRSSTEPHDPPMILFGGKPP